METAIVLGLWEHVCGEIWSMLTENECIVLASILEYCALKNP